MEIWFLAYVWVASTSKSIVAYILRLCYKVYKLTAQQFLILYGVWTIHATSKHKTTGFIELETILIVVQGEQENSRVGQGLWLVSVLVELREIPKASRELHKVITEMK